MVRRSGPQYPKILIIFLPNALSHSSSRDSLAMSGSTECGLTNPARAGRQQRQFASYLPWSPWHFLIPKTCLRPSAVAGCARGPVQTLSHNAGCLGCTRLGQADQLARRRQAEHHDHPRRRPRLRRPLLLRREGFTVSQHRLAHGRRHAVRLVLRELPGLQPDSSGVTEWHVPGSRRCAGCDPHSSRKQLGLALTESNASAPDTQGGWLSHFAHR